MNSSGTIGGVCGSKNYTYGDSVWKDKLTKYGTYNITYDEIGNPLNYRNGITFSWKNGRWLASTTLSGNTTVTYQYNANGMRTKKTIGSTATNYYYDSNNNLIGLKSGADVAYFYYDTDNSPISMKYNNNMYYYVKNLQGDIVKILDSNGSAVASYYYDAWGTITRKTVNNTTIDTLSPFRYRGYVYDTDTGLYYLQSRYYDPTTGRFLNADVYIDTHSETPLSTNMFAYCESNCVNNTDNTGEWWSTIKQYRRFRVDSAKYQADMYDAMGYRTMYQEYQRKYNIRNMKASGIASRYRYNKKKIAHFTDYIYNQMKDKSKSFSFGRKSTVGKTGCVAVALFNTMRKIGKNKHLANIIMELELNNLLVNDGAFGVSDSGVNKYILNNVKYKHYTNYSKYKKNSKKYKAAVVLIDYPSGGGHAFCIIRNSKKKLKSLNYGPNDTKACKINWKDLKSKFDEAFCVK